MTAFVVPNCVYFSSNGNACLSSQAPSERWWWNHPRCVLVHPPVDPRLRGCAVRVERAPRVQMFQTRTDESTGVIVGFGTIQDRADPDR